MLYKEDISRGVAYVYPTQGANSVRPHAVTSIPIIGSFTYDDNGNQKSGAGRTTDWNSFDMPVQIVMGTAKSVFVYGPEHQRTRQTRTDAAGVATDVIYSGSQELETKGGQVTVKTYWPLGVGMEIDRPGATAPELSWTHTDRLGSVVALTDQGGNLKEKLAYDAWGKRRTLDGGATPDALDGQADNRGFTGHEMLDELDLVHMNGRVYDPKAARFLSGDVLVQDPTNGQSHNRYSYVLNNPTNLVDPTGFAVSGGMWTVCGACDSSPRLEAEPAPPPNPQVVVDGVRVVDSSQITPGVTGSLGGGSSIRGRDGSSGGGDSIANGVKYSLLLANIHDRLKESLARKLWVAGRGSFGYALTQAGMILSTIIGPGIDGGTDDILSASGRGANLRGQLGVEIAAAKLVSQGFLILAYEVVANIPGVPYSRRFDLVAYDPVTESNFGVEVKTTMRDSFKLNFKQVAFDVLTVKQGALTASDILITGVMYRGISFGTNPSAVWKSTTLIGALKAADINFSYTKSNLP